MDALPEDKARELINAVNYDLALAQAGAFADEARGMSRASGKVGVALGHLARKRIRQSGEQGLPLTMIGLALGYVGTLGWLTYLVMANRDALDGGLYWVLLGVIIWAVLNNRVSRRRHQESERATADLYDEQDRIDREKRMR